MTTVITSFADRGGVGKTTVAMMLAHGLSAIHGKNVLCIDLDDTPRLSQAMLGRQAHMMARVQSRTLSQIIASAALGAPADPCPSIKTQVGMIRGLKGPAPLALLPGDERITDQVLTLIGHLSRGNNAPSTADAKDMIQLAIRKVIETVKTAYDCLVIDGPPRDNVLIRGAISASDLVVMPYMPGPGSGVVLAETIAIAAPYEVKALAVPNMVQNSAGFGHKNRIDELQGAYPHLLDMSGAPFAMKLVPQLANIIEAPETSDLTAKDRYGSALSTVKALCELVSKELHVKAKEAA
ncbi:MAG: ParA family protein [Hyphomicrobiaceae bacterium]|nr:ParA family protein [Hyphomicrobiaceae bacterium]